MPVTYGRVITYRQELVSTLNALTDQGILIRDNKLLGPEEKAKRLESIQEEILRVQEALDKAELDDDAEVRGRSIDKGF